MSSDEHDLSALTEYLKRDFGLKVVISTMPWGEKGLLEAPFFAAEIADYLGHRSYSARPQAITIEDALLALSARIAADQLSA